MKKYCILNVIITVAQYKRKFSKGLFSGLNILWGSATKVGWIFKTGLVSFFLVKFPLLVNGHYNFWKLKRWFTTFNYILKANTLTGLLLILLATSRWLLRIELTSDALELLTVWRSISFVVCKYKQCRKSAFVLAPQNTERP